MHVAYEICLKFSEKELENFKNKLPNIILNNMEDFLNNSEYLEINVNTELDYYNRISNDRCDDLRDDIIEKIVKLFDDNGIFNNIPDVESDIWKFMEENGFDQLDSYCDDEYDFYVNEDFDTLDTAFGNIKVESCNFWMPFD